MALAFILAFYLKKGEEGMSLLMFAFYSIEKVMACCDAAAAIGEGFKSTSCLAKEIVSQKCKEAVNLTLER